MSSTKNKNFHQIPDANYFLGKLLSRIRNRKLSMRSICHVAGVSPALVCQWKRGAVEPKLSSLRRIEAALNALTEVRA